jgi:protein involved in ribonucleotide reduction
MPDRLVPIYYYSSKSGMVDQFCREVCAGTGRRSFHLAERSNRLSVPDGPWVLVTPSYKTGNADNDTIPEAVRRFLGNPVTRRRLAGIMSSGNRNFGDYYQASGRTIAKLSGRPVLFEFELQGTPWDWDGARQILTELDAALAAADTAGGATQPVGEMN